VHPRNHVLDEGQDSYRGTDNIDGKNGSDQDMTGGQYTHCDLEGTLPIWCRFQFGSSRSERSSIV